MRAVFFFRLGRPPLCLSHKRRCAVWDIGATVSRATVASGAITWLGRLTDSVTAMIARKRAPR